MSNLIKPTVFVRPWQAWIVEMATYSPALTVPNWSNIGLVKTALEALTWTEIGNFQEFTITGVKDNEQEYLSDKCNVWSIARTFSEREDVSFNWIDAANLDIYNKFMNFYFETTATTKTVSKVFQDYEAKFIVLRFTVCDLPWYDITYAEDLTKKLVDTHYIAKTSLTSEFAKRYYALWNQQTAEFPTMEFTWEKWWFYVFDREELPA